MARYFLLMMMIGVVCKSCKDRNPEMVSNAISSYEISTEKWPEKSEVIPKAKEVLEDWEEYNAFETSFDALYNVANRDDLGLTIDDLIEKQKTLEASEYPETFDRPQIKSRQKVFKTYMLKIKGDLHYRKNPEESVLQMITAFNAFRNQFNVVANNTLNTDLILEE